jgi:hypothetical protein
MKLLQDTQPKEQMAANFLSYVAAYEQVNLHLSGQQLVHLHKLAGVTIQDVLTAFIIILINAYCFDNDEQRITHADTIINFRGVSDSISPVGYFGNSVFLMQSDDFKNFQSLTNITLAILSSIIRSCEKTFLEPYLATMDGLLRKIARENLECNIKHYPNEIIINCNLKYDWAKLVDFGFTDKCRFHTAGAGVYYLRIFRLNPIQDGTQWIARDCQGAEVAFLIDKDIKNRFMNVWHKMIDENFAELEKYN